jgi:hypothetical protein
MNRIILDHLKRWWWLWLVIGIANGFSTGAFLNEKHGFDGFSFQIVLWLGAMQLNFDLQRGISRTLTTLPLTARQIGRSWWIVSVALPALLLITTSALALMIHSSHTGKPFPLNIFATNITINILFLGAMFALFVGELPGWPQDVLGWLRRICSVGLLIVIMFSKMTSSTPLGIALYLIAFVLTVGGWFRAEQMVIQRTTFRPGIQSGKHPAGRHQAPTGFGGLAFLWQTLAIRIARMAIVVVVWFVVMHFALHKGSKMSPQQFFAATLPALNSFGFFAIFIFLLMPVLMQLRHLRSLPISTTAIAALLTLLPAVPVLIVGMIWAAIGGGGFETLSGFLAYAAIMSIAAPLMVGQGLRQGAFIATLALLMFLGMGSIFMNGKMPDAFIVTAISLGTIAITFEITRRLLKSSSHAYRPLPANMTAWGGWR